MSALCIESCFQFLAPSYIINEFPSPFRYINFITLGRIKLRKLSNLPAQLSSSASDCGSKLRGSSQNSPSVASKRDVNKTKSHLQSSSRSLDVPVLPCQSHLFHNLETSTHMLIWLDHNYHKILTAIEELFFR
ncbi:hypothetical protein AVEN_205916-1 [Araneus ventricosus]|uniref:Uncharacterized protein n=1 Tax=Araneus ventricosus TaxID=182803 RepID=A0A4Y2V5Z6_ARAVE|nr:hypothetical protein AVEN_205916-1 [Araneus ventricosus]